MKSLKNLMKMIQKINITTKVIIQKMQEKINPIMEIK